MEGVSTGPYAGHWMNVFGSSGRPSVARISRMSSYSTGRRTSCDM